MLSVIVDDGFSSMTPRDSSILQEDYELGLDRNLEVRQAGPAPKNGIVQSITEVTEKCRCDAVQTDVN